MQNEIQMKEMRRKNVAMKTKAGTQRKFKQLLRTQKNFTNF